MGNDYETWKKGEKVHKAPWVIKYWENITDENQHRYAKIVEDRAILILSILGFLMGLFFGMAIMGWFIVV
jgi:hypothetical protein